MKKLITLCLAACSSLALANQPPLIPKPVSYQKLNGSFSLKQETAIRFSTGLEQEAQFLSEALKKRLAFPFSTYNNQLRIALYNPIELQLIQGQNFKKEGYSLSITPDKVLIQAGDKAGIFYGCQTLLQLLNQNAQSLPACQIKDYPRFAWRGMHLDVGRHLFPVKDIEKFIDWMAFHKLNTFHWHLTEDQGWRIEIKKYPKLTQVGAWRASTPPYGERNGSDHKRYGGFYTQKEIKRLVAYAKARHITIVPEIDMPGHMSAAIASYPELGNTDIANYKPSVATKWGVFPYTLSPKESTFTWVENVLDEVCALFPSTYIHIGGDEAPKEQWKASPFAQKVMKRENLPDEHALQSYFIGRVEKILQKKGRRLIGWDEIREGGLSPHATMMLWRSWDHAIASINEGHDIVMAPGSHVYFDHYQYDPEAILSQGKEFEAIGGYRTIQSVYSFNPIPKEFQGTQKARHVLGCQAQLWTEYMKTWDKVEYSAFPRIAALAEVAWTPQEARQWEDFQERLQPTIALYKKAGIHTFDPFHPPVIKGKNGMSATSSLPVYQSNKAVRTIDQNPQTFFWSSRSPKEGDTFCITFPKASQRKLAISMQTGSDQGKDKLEKGIFEACGEDGSWQKLGDFKEGHITVTTPKGTKAIRLFVTAPQGSWLVIKEISVKAL